MPSPKEFKVDDIAPGVVESVKFILDDMTPFPEREYAHRQHDGTLTEGKRTDADGLVEERNFIAAGNDIKLKPRTEQDDDSTLEADNPGPMQALDLRNKSEGGTGPLRRGDHRSSLVEHLQKMLKSLGYDIGATGPNSDGVDGIFGSKTEKAVKDFQSQHKDWEGSNLKVDGIVGPRTCDSMNRVLVGLWYEKYETPRELTKELKLVTMTEKVAEVEGIIL